MNSQPTTIEDLIKEAWKQHSEAEQAGDFDKATEIKAFAFTLLGQLPEFQTTLRIKQ